MVALPRPVGLSYSAAAFAPMIAVFPSADNATELPKLSFAAPFFSVIVFCCVHLVPERVKTVALPWLDFPPTVAWLAPMIAVFPLDDNATELPKLSPTAPLV